MKRLAWVLLSVAGCLSTGWAHSDDRAAGVEQLHELLLTAMTLPEQSARENLLGQHVLALFDVQTIARISAGQSWRSLPEEKRREYVDLLSQLIVATYADRFDAFNGQSFVTEEIRPARSGHVVLTRLLRPNDTPVSLDYYLRDNKVFNVVADGVSDLSLRRADYSSIIKNEGFDSLLTHLARKVALARGESNP